MKLDSTTWEKLIQLADEREVYLEGNVLKVIDSESNARWALYLSRATSLDSETRKRRLEITKQIQTQNIELQEIQKRLRDALINAENAKNLAEQDLEILRKKTQYHLMKQIVKISLTMIVGVGLLTTALYLIALISDKNTELLGNTWSSMIGIILTNSFSIVGTVLGIKYANEEKSKD